MSNFLTNYLHASRHFNCCRGGFYFSRRYASIQRSSAWVVRLFAILFDGVWHGTHIVVLHIASMLASTVKENVWPWVIKCSRGDISTVQARLNQGTKETMAVSAVRHCEIPRLRVTVRRTTGGHSSSHSVVHKLLNTMFDRKWRHRLSWKEIKINQKSNV